VKSREEKLIEYISKCGSLAIAFSGGTDSTVLAKAASLALPAKKVLLVHIDSVFVPEDERFFAREWAAKNCIPLEVIKIDPLKEKKIVENGRKRCYHCKKVLMGKVIELAHERGIENVADGLNKDDLNDYRPGIKASDELGIKHPLLEAGLNKQEVRMLSEKWKLPNWNTPASACLASRIPYNSVITVEKLKMVDAAEHFLRKLGFAGCRVRYYSGSAKIEVSGTDLNEIVSSRDIIIHRFKQIGFKEIMLDLGGYRQGALNEL
jgi:uncharacterized protein